MASWFDSLRYGVGTAVENVGNRLGIPETGFSEMIAGRSTPGTVRQANASEYNAPNASVQTSSQVPSSFWNQQTTTPTYNVSQPPQPGSIPPSGQQTNNGGNDAMMAYFDQASGQLGQTQSDLEAQVNNLFSGSQSTINTSLTGSLADLGASKTKVESNTTTGLRDLAKSMRGQLEAGAQKIGGIPGAASSTGANMYNYALGKVGNQNRADMMKQANELKSNIDLQVNKVKQTAQDQLSQLETWKNSQLLQISQYIQQQRGMIDQAKAQQIYSHLQNIDTQANTFKQSLYTWAMNNSTSLDQLKQKLAGFGQNPTDVSQSGFPQLEFGPMTTNTGDQQVGLWNKKTPGQAPY